MIWKIYLNKVLKQSAVNLLSTHSHLNPLNIDVQVHKVQKSPNIQSRGLHRNTWQLNCWKSRKRDNFENSKKKSTFSYRREYSQDCQYNSQQRPCRPRREYDDTFKVLKEKNTKIALPNKAALQIRRDEDFPKWKLRRFNSTRLTLQEILKGVPQAEMKVW